MHVVHRNNDRPQPGIFDWNDNLLRLPVEVQVEEDAAEGGPQREGDQLVRDGPLRKQSIISFNTYTDCDDDDDDDDWWWHYCEGYVMLVAMKL